MLKEQITSIIYKNSHDCSDGLVINFENIQKIISLLCEETENKQPVIKPDIQEYEILCLKSSLGSWYLKEDGFFRNENSLVFYSLFQILNDINTKHLSIESVKRLSDGQVFSVGDGMKYKGKENELWGVNRKYCIIYYFSIKEGFIFVNDHFENIERVGHISEWILNVPEIVILTTEDGVVITDPYARLYGVNTQFHKMWNLTAKNYANTDIILFKNEPAMNDYILINKYKIILTTEDGVNITNSKQMIYGVEKDFSCTYNISANNYEDDTPKYFSTEIARDEYILQNKPITVTHKEMLEHKKDNCNNYNTTAADDLKEFFKSKQKS